MNILSNMSWQIAAEPGSPCSIVASLPYNIKCTEETAVVI